MTLPSAPLATRLRFASPLPKTATGANRPFARKARHRLTSATASANSEAYKALLSRQSAAVAQRCADHFPHQQRTTPCHSPSAKPANCPNTASFTRGKGRAHLTAPHHRPDPTQFSKSAALPASTPLNLPVTVRPASLLLQTTWPCRLRFLFSRSARFLPQPLAQR